MLVLGLGPYFAMIAVNRIEDKAVKNDNQVSHGQPLGFRLQYRAAHVVRVLKEVWYHLVRVPFDRVVWVLWRQGWGVPLASLSRRNAFRAFGDATELWVDPQSLEQVVSVKEAGFPKRDFISSRDWDLRGRGIGYNERYVMLADLWAHRSDLRSSNTFKDYQRRMQVGRPVRTINKLIYLNSDETILEYLREQLLLLDSVSESGVIKGTTADDIKVAVDRQGRLVKVNGGRKRTAAAIIVGAPALPVRVCHIHEQYLKKFMSKPKEREKAVRKVLDDLYSRYGVDL